MELRDKHSGQHVAIGIATGAHVVAPSGLGAVYEFELKFGPAPHEPAAVPMG